MAEVLEDYVFERTARRHNWDTWLDGKKRRLFRGQDFLCTVKSMQAQAHSRAKKMGRKVNTALEENAIVIRATGMDGNELDGSPLSD